nr:hypothetical protein Iba_scaffold5206CG0010 [Ipomoea batatas]
MRSSYASPSKGNPPRMCKSRSEIVTSPCDVTRVFVSGHHASQKHFAIVAEYVLSPFPVAFGERKLTVKIWVIAPRDFTVKYTLS